MVKFLITGSSGFVANHFINYLESSGIKANILGLDLAPKTIQKTYKHVEVEFENVDLLNKEQLKVIITKFCPNYILHLASYSSVAFSWQNPVSSFLNNTNIFLNLLEVIRECNITCRILSIGSSEEYGNVNASEVPLSETRHPAPISPYAVARVSQEMLSIVYSKGYSLDIVMTRSFNHIGPGQKENFAISSFAKQIVLLKMKGEKTGTIKVGNVSIIRDFLDVRDVVNAYYKLFISGSRGEIYNVCSGVGVTLEQIIRMLAEINEIDIVLQVDEQLIRPDDNKIIIGDNSKIVKQTAWENIIPLHQSLADITKYWKGNL